MAELPSCRVTVCNKAFKFAGLDYLGPFYFRQGRSDCKAWGLLFTCLCTRCLLVELVTSLDLDSFLLAFSRFTNLRGAIERFTTTMLQPFALHQINCQLCWDPQDFIILCANLILTGLIYPLMHPVKAEAGRLW